MPTAWDPPGRHAVADKDPLRNLLDFNNIDQTIERSGDLIRSGVLNVILQFTGLDLSSPEAFITSLIDLITTGGPAAEFATAILGIFTDALGIGPIEDVLPKIFAAFNGIDLDGDPGAIRDWLERLVFGQGDQVEQYPPYTPPFQPSAVSQTARMFALLRRFLNWGDIGAEGFDFNAAVRNTIATLLAQNMLAELVDGKVPIEQIPEALLDLFRRLIDLITPGQTIPTAPGGVLAAVWNAFAHLVGISTTAQSQANTAATQAAANTAAINAASDPTFTSVVDLEFNTVATTGISGNYTTLYIGSGAGNLAADGLGNAIWLPSGNIARTGYARHVTALNSDNFELQLILDEVIPAPVLGGQTYVWILGRIKADLSSFTAVRIGYNTVTVGDALTSGTFLPRSAPQAITSAPGDSWIFRGGYSDVTHGPWRLKTLQNNLTRLDYTDTGHNANIGSLYRGVGFGYTVAARDNSGQLVPPKILSFSASDRSPAAA